MGADAIVGVVASGVLMWIIYGPWQMVCTDATRCKLFILRDQLFDIAADGRLSFESAEYNEIRTGLNLMIRYAHRLTAPRLAVMIFSRNKRERAGVEITRLIASIPDAATRDEVWTIFARAMDATFTMVRMKSPVLSVAYAVIYATYKSYQMIAHRSAGSVWAIYRDLRAKSAELMLSGAFCSET